MWGVVALALVAGGGLWWWNKRAPAQGEQASAGASAQGGGRPGGGRRGPGGPGGPGGAMGAQAQPVSVGVVERRDMRVLISAIGTMNPRATAVVRAKVSGELLRLHFK